METASREELEAWIEECDGQLRDNTGGYTVERVREDEFLLLYGLAARTMRFAAAFIRLIRSGFEAEAMPLARAALEHAVSLQWIFTVHGGVGRYSRSVGHDRIEYYERLAEWLDSDDIRSELARNPIQPRAGKRLPKFMTMLRDLDAGKFLETSYAVLSQQVHVTHDTVTSAIHARDGEPLGVRYGSDVGDTYPAIYTVAVACMLSRWVVARLTDDEALLEYLDKSSDRLVIPMTLLDQVPAGMRRAGL